MKTLLKLLLLAGLSVPAAALASGTDANWRQMGFSSKGSRHNPHETVLNTGNVANLSLAWSQQTGDVIRSSPAIVDGVVYAGSWDGKLYAFHEATGAVKWTASAPGIRNSSPAVANGMVYVGSDDGPLYAFHTRSGAPAWTAQLRRFSISSPTVADGVVYISAVGKLYAFDGRTGTPRWSVKSGSGTSTPAVLGGVVYETKVREGLRAYDAATGAVLWRKAAPIISAPALARGVVYSVYSNGSNAYGVAAFDAGSHKVLWQSPFGGFSQSDLAVAGGLVYAGSFDGNLYAFDARSGAQKWVFKVGTEVDDVPAVANGVVYVASTEDGVHRALDASSGAPLWSAPATGHFMFSSPSVVNGMVFVGSDDGKLYVYRLNEPRSTAHITRPR